MSGLEPGLNLLAKADAMLSDGASQAEVRRTFGVTKAWMLKHFRGRGWTYVQAGEFRALQMWGPRVEGL